MKWDYEEQESVLENDHLWGELEQEVQMVPVDERACGHLMGQGNGVYSWGSHQVGEYEREVMEANIS